MNGASFIPGDTLSVYVCKFRMSQLISEQTSALYIAALSELNKLVNESM